MANPIRGILNSTSFQELSLILDKIEKGGLNKTDLDSIKERITQIYNDKKSSDQKGISNEEYKDLDHLLFQIREIDQFDSKTVGIFSSIFSKERELKKIEDDCKIHLHQDRLLMKSIIQNYDHLAEQYNKMIEQGYQKKDLEPQLKVIRYLNSIIGLPWNEEQKAGRTCLPLMSDRDLLNSEAPKSMKLEDCKSIFSLYALICDVSQNENSGKFRDKIVIPGVGVYHYDTIKSMLKHMLINEFKSYPFQKSKLAYTANLLIDLINQLNPRSSRETSTLDNLKKQCLNEIKRDPEIMEIAKKEYNTLAKAWNREILKKHLQDNPFVHLTSEDKLKFKSLSHLFDLNLSIDQFNMNELVPILGEPIAETFENYKLYTQFSMIVNYEIELREKIQKLEVFKYQINPNNPLSVLLSQEDKVTINAKVEELKSWLSDKCLSNDQENRFLSDNLKKYLIPESLFKSMIKECNTLATSLELQLTESQLRGETILPILDIQFEPNTTNVIKKLKLINSLNYQIEKINNYLKIVITM